METPQGKSSPQSSSKTRKSSSGSKSKRPESNTDVPKIEDLGAGKAAARPKGSRKKVDGDGGVSVRKSSSDSGSVARKKRGARKAETAQTVNVSMEEVVDALEMLPKPIQFMRSFEYANMRAGEVRVWRELGMRSRQRKTDMLGGRDWHPNVFLPADVVSHLIDKGHIQIPATEAWSEKPRASVARAISMLASWQVDRMIYEFTDLGCRIVENGFVAMPLQLKPFNLMPSFAIYVDLVGMNARFDEHFGFGHPNDKVNHAWGNGPLPHGFFCGLNASKDGVLELVFLILGPGDRFSVDAVNLDGQTLDVVMAKHLSKVREDMRGLPKDSTPALSHLHLSREARLHFMISALLLTCIGHSKHLNITEDRLASLSLANGHALRPTWTRWLAGNGVVPSVEKEYESAIKAGRFDKGRAPIVMANWNTGTQESLVQLRCHIARGYDLSRFMKSSVKSG